MSSPPPTAPRKRSRKTRNQLPLESQVAPKRRRKRTHPREVAPPHVHSIAAPAPAPRQNSEGQRPSVRAVVSSSGILPTEVTLRVAGGSTGVPVFGGHRTPTADDLADGIMWTFPTEMTSPDGNDSDWSGDGIGRHIATLGRLMGQLHAVSVLRHALSHEMREAEETENAGDAVDRVAEVCAVDITTAAQALSDAHGDENIAVEILLERKTAETAITKDDEDKAKVRLFFFAKNLKIAKLDMAIAMSLQKEPDKNSAAGPAAPRPRPAAVDAPSEDKCPVCLEVIWDRPGAKKFKFPCSHDVCLDCGDQLVRRALSCPVCRRPISGMIECVKTGQT